MFNYVVDPAAYFRRPTLYEHALSGPQRVVSAGIVRNYPFDGIAIGSSATANFKTSQMERLFGGRFAKVTLYGAKPYETAAALTAAFDSRGKIDTVLWSVDPFYWLQPADGRNPAFPDYMYHPPGGELIRKYVLSLQTVRQSVLELEASRAVKGPLSFDRYTTWEGTCAFGCKPGCEAVKAYVSAWVNSASVSDRSAISKSNEAVYQQAIVDQTDRYLIPILRAHPQTQFKLFVPPTSAAEQFTIAVKDPAATLQRDALKRRIIEIARSYPNVSFYDFNEMPELTDNLDFYYDWQHYSGVVGERMIAVMAVTKELPTTPAQLDRIFGLTYASVFKQCLR